MVAHKRDLALVRRVITEIWNGGDLALADRLFAPTYRNYGGLIPDLVCGPEAIKSGILLYRLAFPRFHLTVEALVAEGELVVLHWAARRARPGPAGGAPSAGGVLRGTTRSRCVAGQIAESWTVWDQKRVLAALGRLPPEGGAARDAACAGPGR